MEIHRRQFVNNTRPPAETLIWHRYMQGYYIILTECKQSFVTLNLNVKGKFGTPIFFGVKGVKLTALS